MNSTFDEEFVQFCSIHDVSGSASSVVLITGTKDQMMAIEPIINLEDRREDINPVCTVHYDANNDTSEKQIDQ